MWKNRHVVIALLVAPMLAIMAWFAVDYFVGEKAEPARAGASYPLVAKSNCRYNSGRCDLVNGDFEVALSMDATTAGGTILLLESRHALERATAAVVDESGEETVASMAPVDDARTRWSMPLALPTGEGARFRIAAVAGGATYFAEVPVVFTLPETS